MNKKFSSTLALVLPSKRINLFVIFLIVLGIISGSIFLTVLNSSDKELVVSKITTFINNINTNNVNNLEAFKNVLIANFIYIILVWILGMSIIGIVCNIFLVYFRGFTVGFTISSFILAFRYKGILSSFIYMLPGGIISILLTLILGVYSFILTSYLFKTILLRDKSSGISRFLKKYVFILIICLFLAFLYSLADAFLVPSLTKLFIKIFI